MPPDIRGFDPIILFSGDDLREGMGQDSVRPDIDGRLSFTNVSAGRYKLFLRGATNGAAGGPPVRAEAEVVVLDEDIRNVVLDLQPGVTVSGHLVFRGLDHRQLRRWRAPVWRSGSIPPTLAR